MITSPYHTHTTHFIIITVLRGGKLKWLDMLLSGNSPCPALTLLYLSALILTVSLSINVIAQLIYPND